jgi:dTDP-4-amino-4,6-dideoxyglucose formyltransferase
MKHVLFIIDNVIQYERIKEIISNSKREDVVFDFKRSGFKSPLTHHRDFADSSLDVIDVKASIEHIIKTYDLVISVHCFQFFPKELVDNIRCINVHPGYNPINRGWYPQVFSLAYDLPIGATIHEIDNFLDHGPIIARKLVEKALYDTSTTLYHKVLRAEIELLEMLLYKIVDNDYVTTFPEEEGTVYLKRDFESLCELDLNEKGTFGDFYNKLRALTHENYKNAFIIERETGKKIFVSIEVDYE